MEMLTVKVSESYEARSGETVEAGTVLKSATDREAKRNQALLRKGLAEPQCDVAKAFLGGWMRREKASNSRDNAILARAEKERAIVATARRNKRREDFYQVLTSPDAVAVSAETISEEPDDDEERDDDEREGVLDGE